MEKQDPMHFIHESRRKERRGEWKQRLPFFFEAAEVMNRSYGGKMERRREQKLAQSKKLSNAFSGRVEEMLRSRKSAFSMRKKQLSGGRRTTRTHLCNQPGEWDFFAVPSSAFLFTSLFFFLFRLLPTSRTEYEQRARRSLWKMTQCAEWHEQRLRQSIAKTFYGRTFIPSVPADKNGGCSRWRY